MGVDKKITREEFRKLAEKTDWSEYAEKVIWRASYPTCSCKDCPEYIDWLERGKGLYKEDISTYKKIVKEERLLHREGIIIIVSHFR